MEPLNTASARGPVQVEALRRYASYLLRAIVSINLFIFIWIALNESSDRIHSVAAAWFTRSSVAAILLGAFALSARPKSRGMANLIFDLFFTAIAFGLIVFYSISSVPSL